MTTWIVGGLSAVVIFVGGYWFGCRATFHDIWMDVATAARKSDGSMELFLEEMEKRLHSYMGVNEKKLKEILEHDQGGD